MKKALLSVLAIFIIYSTTKAQTTLEEYNYVTKGYKTQLESGLDMKKGYELKQIHKRMLTGKDGVNRQFTMFALVRSADKSVACYMVKYQNLSENKDKYMCIPDNASDASILNKAIADNIFLVDSANAYTQFLAEIIASNSKTIKEVPSIGFTQDK